MVIPVPSEIFNALDKLGGNPNWNSEIGTDSKAQADHPAADRPAARHVIANGFIAVQAKDDERVKEIGRRVIDLSMR